MKVFTALLTVTVLFAASANAGFMVEAHSSGLANGNFAFGGDTTTASASAASKAYGVTASNSIYGGNGVDMPDTYIYSYTPGTDVDNVDLPAGTDLGNGDLASGLMGGASGLYNVYTTWPSTDNSNAAGVKITITSDGGDVVFEAYDQNGYDANPGGDKWVLLAEGISLTAGTTYTFTQEANVNSFVSMRSHGVMWEAVPEPATMVLLGFGAFLVRKRR